MEFLKFKNAVAAQFAKMSKSDLFYVKVEKDLLWDTYLSSFPEGSDPIFRTRRGHDCNCCKQFIRTIGGLVSIKDNSLISIWDVTLDDPNYQAVANALSTLVKSKPIDNIFLHYEKSVGTDKSFEKLVEGVSQWRHFYVELPKNSSGRLYTVPKADKGPLLANSQSSKDVFLRGLTEITENSIETVLELIAQNSLYRGEEHKFVLTQFLKVKKEFSALKVFDHDIFAWSKIQSLPPAVSRIRNSSIGTLLTDLSDNVEIDVAVRSFESKVAPANYKRPTAIVTKAMIDKAKLKVEELGLTSSLDRRYATLTDISVNNIIFVDRESKKVITNNVFDELSSKLPDKSYSKVEEVSIDKFITDIIPKADSVEILVENRLKNNLVSLISPTDASANLLFKWDNNFSWTYNGDFADSIKERVKKAGGDVSGDVCCRLSWFNYDDLDLSMVEPPNSYRIYYGNRGNASPCGGNLDVDMNAGSGKTREAVENIFYKSSKTMKNGSYSLRVHNYCQRESIDVGFEVEIDIKGEVYSFKYDQLVKDQQLIEVAKIEYSKSTDEFKVVPTISGSSVSASKLVWNIQTENFNKVNLIMLSPNYWNGEGVGNKHYFFMIDKCANEGTARGFYNEFIRSELDPHRKVIELVGSKVRTDNSENQLSGLGFSTTVRNYVVCRVKGTFNRVVKVMF